MACWLNSCFFVSVDLVTSFNLWKCQVSRCWEQFLFVIFFFFFLELPNFDLSFSAMNCLSALIFLWILVRLLKLVAMQIWANSWPNLAKCLHDGSTNCVKALPNLLKRSSTFIRLRRNWTVKRTTFDKWYKVRFGEEWMFWPRMWLVFAASHNQYFYLSSFSLSFTLYWWR